MGSTFVCHYSYTAMLSYHGSQPRGTHYHHSPTHPNLPKLGAHLTATQPSHINTVLYKISVTQKQQQYKMKYIFVATSTAVQASTQPANTASQMTIEKPMAINRSKIQNYDKHSTRVPGVQHACMGPLRSCSVQQGRYLP